MSQPMRDPHRPGPAGWLFLAVWAAINLPHWIANTLQPLRVAAHLAREGRWKRTT
jgi:hypothetical protein